MYFMSFACDAMPRSPFARLSSCLVGSAVLSKRHITMLSSWKDRGLDLYCPRPPLRHISLLPTIQRHCVLRCINICKLTSFSSLLRFYFKAKPVQNLKNVTKRYKWNSRMCLNMSAMTRETKPKPRLYTSHVGKKQLTHYMVIGVHTCSHWLDVKPLFSQIGGAAALYASRHRTEWLFSYS